MEAVGLAIGMAIGLPLFLALVALVLPWRGRLHWAYGGSAVSWSWSVVSFAGLMVWQRASIEGRTRSRLLVLGRRIGRRGRPAAPKERREAGPSSASARRRYPRGDPLFWLARAGLVQRWIQLAVGALREIVAAARLDPVTLRIRIGLGDPASTGAAYGFLWSLVGPTMAFVPYQSLEVHPRWFESTFECAGRLGGWCRPSDTILVLLRLVCRAPWRETLRALWQRRALRRRPSAQKAASVIGG